MGTTETGAGATEPDDRMSLVKRLNGVPRPIKIVAPGVAAGSVVAFSHPLAAVAGDVGHVVHSLTATDFIAVGAGIAVAAVPRLRTVPSPETTPWMLRGIAVATAAGLAVGTGIGEATGAWGWALPVAGVVGLGGGVATLARGETMQSKDGSETEAVLTRRYRRAAIPGIWLASAATVTAIGDATGLHSVSTAIADRGLGIGITTAAIPSAAAYLAHRRAKRSAPLSALAE